MATWDDSDSEGSESEEERTNTTLMGISSEEETS